MKHSTEKLLYTIFKTSVEIYLCKGNKDKAKDLFDKFLNLQENICINPDVLKKTRNLLGMN